MTISPSCRVPMATMKHAASWRQWRIPAHARWRSGKETYCPNPSSCQCGHLEIFCEVWFPFVENGRNGGEAQPGSTSAIYVDNATDCGEQALISVMTPR